MAAEPLRGCKSPDWYYVPGVPPMLGGTYRRSYVLWQEHQPPRVALEFVSGDGSEEHDATPETGKFWVYEQAIRIAYYGIFESEQDRLEMYHLVEGRYQRMTPNAHGRFFMAPLGVEIGIWHGTFDNMTLPWLRWWDAQGNLLLAGRETAELERRERASGTAGARRTPGETTGPASCRSGTPRERASGAAGRTGAAGSRGGGRTGKAPGG